MYPWEVLFGGTFFFFSETHGICFFLSGVTSSEVAGGYWGGGKSGRRLLPAVAQPLRVHVCVCV